MTDKSIKILGIDPGIVNVGWGVISAPNLAYFRSGAIINNHANLKDKIRNTLIELESILYRYAPDIIAYEDPIFQGRGQTGPDIHKTLGALFILASKFKLPIYSYSATAIKYMIAGHGKAGKKQIEMATKQLLRMDESYPFNTNHESDALASAATHYLKTTINTRE